VAQAFTSLAEDLGEDERTPEGEDDGLLCPSEAAAAFFSGAGLGVPPFLPFSASAVSVASRAADVPLLPTLYEFFAVAMSERDKRVLFGDPDPATGALLRFLNAVNAAAAADATRTPVVGEPAGTLAPPAVGVVYVHASAKGQFMLRELLDAGDSTTHVTEVKKDRLLFVVCVAEEDVDVHAAAGDTAGGRRDGVQPQLVSRAHDIVPCGAETTVRTAAGEAVTVQMFAKL
jgi:hypothetical protein